MTVMIQDNDDIWYPLADCVRLYAGPPHGRDKNEAPRACIFPTGETLDVEEFNDPRQFVGAVVYEVRGKVHEYIEDAERVLRDEFWEMIRETSTSIDDVKQYEDDDPLRRGTFADWTDSLCKDGLICEDTYNEVDIDD